MQNGKTSLKVSDQIELRLPDTSFTEQLFKIVDQQRSHLRPWLNWVDQAQSSSHIKEFLRTSKLFNKGGQKLTTFIFNGDQILGSVGLVSINKDHRIAEIGYWLRADFQGRGIMTQCCKRLIRYTFKNMDINRIEIKVASPNIKSLAIPKNLGFTHEATLRQALLLYGTYFDLELLSLLKKEWADSV